MLCPKCGKTVEYLKNYAPGTIVFLVRLVDGYLDYDREDITAGEDGEYECPNCGVELASNNDDALAFMKGEGISDEMVKYYAELAMQG